MNYYLAVDIGASSGRHVVGWKENGKLLIEEIYRFENKQIRRNGHDCWEVDVLLREILNGMKKCGEQGKIPASMGIDTWAVDFALVDAEGNQIGDTVAYRDARTEGADAQVEQIISPQELYGKTGIQKQLFNTIYQLTALKREHPEQLEGADRLLMIPDYLNFLLTGEKKQEYTNATSTNLVDAESGDWDRALLERLGFPQRLFGELSMPGTEVGSLLPAIAEAVGYQTKVVLPATHDTGSAFLAVPTDNDSSVYLSSGTWSLLGVENEKPITSEGSRLQNFTNEGGAWHRYRYLKNIMGLWMIQSVRRELNGEIYIEGKEKRNASDQKWSFPDLIHAAEECEEFRSVVDVNQPCFMAPDSMIEAIREECRRTGQPAPEGVGEVMQCVYNSLALCYRDAITELRKLTGKEYTAIHIVGGGCQDGYLNRKTAAVTGLPVFAGPVEGTAIGNLMVQMISAGEFESLQTARKAVAESFAIKEEQP